MLKALSRLMLAGIFILGGSSAFLEPGGRVQKVGNAGIPQAKQAVTLNAATMVFGGTLLALDIAPRLAALMLLASLVPTTFVGHSFWKEENPASRHAQETQFLKNLAMMGGLLLVLREG